jgi:predicted AlkP superfamily pyrophosphatase or phosphodiesterase
MTNEETRFTEPDYGRNTIANIPGTLAALFAIPFSGLPPLSQELWQPLQTGEIRRIVLILVDAFGENLLRLLEVELAGLLGRATVRGDITSIFPSTTVAALSSLWTGAAPAQHGLVGLQMFLAEYATMGQMLSLTTTATWQPNALVEAGLDPTTFLQAPGIGEQFAKAGIPVFAVKNYRLVGTGLSRMHSRGVRKSYGIVGSADMMWQLRTLLEDAPDDRFLTMAYWPAVDTLSHRYGYDHEAVFSEVRAFFTQLQTELIAKLSPRAREGTVLLLTADHGQIGTPLEHHIYLEDHPRLNEHLLMPPGGEPRALYFYARQGRQPEVLAYLRENLGHAVHAMSSAEALAQGLFGPQPHAAVTASRLGDVIAVPKDDYSFLSRNEPPVFRDMLGRHGGLTAAEMRVPWLAFRLDQGG